MGGAGLAGVLLLVTASVTGCGGGDKPAKAVASIATATGSSSTPAATASSATGNPAAFAQCMRANGVPNFPDPKNGRSTLPRDIDPQSSQFQTASDKCKQYRGSIQSDPQVTKDTWAMSDKLKYSKCMRDNGLPTFPDPSKDGGLEFDQSIDPASAQFKAAEKACSKYEPQNSGNNGVGGAP